MLTRSFSVKIYSPYEKFRKAWKDVEEEFVGRQDDIDCLVKTAKSIMADTFVSKTVFVSSPYGEWTLAEVRCCCWQDASSKTIAFSTQ